MKNLRVEGRHVIGDNENGSQFRSTFYGPAQNMSDDEKIAFAKIAGDAIDRRKRAEQDIATEGDGGDRALTQSKRISTLESIKAKVIAVLPKYELGSIVCRPNYHDDGSDEHFVVLGVEWRRDTWLYTLGAEPSMWQWGKPIYAACSFVDESDLAPAKIALTVK